MSKLLAYYLEDFAKNTYDAIYKKMDSLERRQMTITKNCLKEKDPEILAKLALSMHHRYVLDRSYDQVDKQTIWPGEKLKKRLRHC